MLGIFLQTYGAGSFENLISQLEQAGTFTYVLPFLFIFALVFGILSRTKIFDSNKGINVILSLAVALMALQTNYVSNFFEIISPLLGVGLVVLLVVVIFLGLVAPKQAWLVYVVFGVSAIILINILLGVAQATGSGWYDWWLQWKTLIIGITVLLGIVFSVIGATSKEDTPFETIASKLLKGITSD
ncbi:MAG: hypothetical protein ABFQ65_03190 [Nanoarchaeota archaeon]